MSAKPAIALRSREVRFTTVHEGWNEYLLEDGTAVRFKTVVAEIRQVLGADGKPSRHADGKPALTVKHQTIINTMAASQS